MKRFRRVLLGLLGLVILLLVLGLRFDRNPATLEAKYATPPSAFVDVGGARVHYRDRGAGPAIVLLHGSNASLFTWDGWVEALAVDHRVVTLDLPGHGLTGPDPKARYSASEMAELVADFTKAIGLERFVVAGNSMGGSVAWHLTVLHPDRVERLILVDSAGLPREEPKPFGFRLASSRIFGPIVRWETPRFMVASSLRDAYGDPSRVTDDLVDRYFDMMLRDGNRSATLDRFSRPQDDMPARLGEINVPTLILWGARDRWILPKYGEQLRARIPNAKLVVLEGLGHVPMEEDPKASVAIVRDFLAR